MIFVFIFKINQKNKNKNLLQNKKFHFQLIKKVFLIYKF